MQCLLDALSKSPCAFLRTTPKGDSGSPLLRVVVLHQQSEKHAGHEVFSRDESNRSHRRWWRLPATPLHSYASLHERKEFRVDRPHTRGSGDSRAEKSSRSKSSAAMSEQYTRVPRSWPLTVVAACSDRASTRSRI